MNPVYSAERLDVAALAREGARLQAQDTLARYPRLLQEADAGAGPADGLAVHWQAQGESRQPVGEAAQAWLHLQVQAELPLTCQRCLQPTTVALEVDRWFRFVADEATAAALDEECEDDVLAPLQGFDLHGLIEDELLMALPLVPRHDTCPRPLDLPGDAAPEPARRPFDVLAGLRSGKAG